MATAMSKSSVQHTQKYLSQCLWSDFIASRCDYGEDEAGKDQKLRE